MKEFANVRQAPGVAALLGIAIVVGSATDPRMALSAANRAQKKSTTKPSTRPLKRRVAQAGSALATSVGRSLARYEPARGAYLGAALDYAQQAAGDTPAAKMTALMRDWNNTSERHHALYLQFIPFPHQDGAFPTWDSDPKGWATCADFGEAASAVSATPILTLEPMQPKLFLDWRPGSPAHDATKTLAEGAGKWGRPLFIRFAHEMNGSWYPWAEWSDKNRNFQRDPGEETGFWPENYKTAYRNVASMFRRFAPNAALVWCPNSGLLGGARRDAFRPFYPGDDVVDWVGLDIYERGWRMPMPGKRLWAGTFGLNLTHDAADDPATPWNESVNFYLTFVQQKNKPMLLCETGATLSYRTDLDEATRARMNHEWRGAYWNANEYGWLQAVYGTSAFDQKLLTTLDKDYPGIKAVVWFQIAKREEIPVEIERDGKVTHRWFENEWTDYRIGGGINENDARKYARDEVDLYQRLTATPYFLSRLVRR